MRSKICPFSLMGFDDQPSRSSLKYQLVKYYEKLSFYGGLFYFYFLLLFFTLCNALALQMRTGDNCAVI